MDIPAYYRVTDPIQSLKLRISLKRIKKAERKGGKSSPSASGASSNNGSDSENNSEAEDPYQDQDQDSEDGRRRSAQRDERKEWARTFAWQEKVFGPRELLRYRPGGVDGESGTEDDVLGRTAIEMEYRSELKRADVDALIAENVDCAMLFSYTDKDGFVPRNELNRFVSTSENFVLNPLAQSILLLPKRADDEDQLRAGKVLNLDLNLNRNGNMLESAGQEDVAKGSWFSSGSAGKRLFRENPCKVFYVMAAVDVNMDAFSKKRMKKDANPSFYEVPLCRVTVNKEGSLVEFKPDLSSPKLYQDEDTAEGVEDRTYRFTTPAGSVYEYSIANVAGNHDQDTAAQLRSIQKEKERIALNELQNRIERGLIGKVKQPGKTRFHVLLEVVKASGFEADQLYIHYEVRLPPRDEWTWVNADKRNLTERAIEGVSQTVKTRVDQHGKVVAHFCFPIELELLYCNQTPSEEPFRVPQLLIQVKSRDRWERHRTEGYGFIRIAAKAGTYSRIVKTWKVGGSIRQKLAEHLIGGALHLDNPMYAAVPELSKDGSFLNRYGFHSDPSGSVEIRMNVMKQVYVPEAVQAQLEKRRFRSRSVGDNDLAGYSSKKIRSVEEIMESLKFGFAKSRGNNSKSPELLKAITKFKEGTPVEDIRQKRKNEMEAQKREEDSRRASIKARLDSMKERIHRRRSVSGGQPSKPKESEHAPLLDDADL